MGVPKVYTDRDVNPLGQKMSKEQNRFPYYLAPQYRQRFFELIAAFGDYVRCRTNSCGKRLGAETNVASLSISPNVLAVISPANCVLAVDADPVQRP